MLKILATGNWPADAVRITAAVSTRRIVPEVESLIETAWQNGAKRQGMTLFDGPLCRLESWHATPQLLELSVSPTSYRIFFGTNLSHAELADTHGRDVLANPVGVSTALLSSDNWLLFGRRNAAVAYYPNRVHPFAGSLDNRDGLNAFAAMRRELHEELRLTDTEVESITCIGIVEDQQIIHPELIFQTRVKRTRAELESRVEKDEHGGSVAIEAIAAAIEKVLGNNAGFTPVGIAALLLFGQAAFGERWFQREQAHILNKQ